MFALFVKALTGETQGGFHRDKPQKLAMTPVFQQKCTQNTDMSFFCQQTSQILLGVMKQAQ